MYACIFFVSACTYVYVYIYIYVYMHACKVCMYKWWLLMFLHIPYQSWSLLEHTSGVSSGCLLGLYKLNQAYVAVEWRLSKVWAKASLWGLSSLTGRCNQKRSLWKQCRSNILENWKAAKGTQAGWSGQCFTTPAVLSVGAHWGWAITVSCLENDGFWYEACVIPSKKQTHSTNK